MARVEVITGPERRRRWSNEQKRAIVAESLAPGAVISEVARRAEVYPGQIYRWRQELRATAEGFAPVLIAPPEMPAPIATNGAVWAEGNVTETGSERAALQGRLPAWISSPTDGIASRRRSSSTRSGFISGLR
jgi:transposase-like protein